MIAARRTTPATIGPAIAPALTFDEELEEATEVVGEAVPCVLDDCVELAVVEVVLTF